MRNHMPCNTMEPWTVDLLSDAVSCLMIDSQSHMPKSSYQLANSKAYELHYATLPTPYAGRGFTTPSKYPGGPWRWLPFCVLVYQFSEKFTQTPSDFEISVLNATVITSVHSTELESETLVLKIYFNSTGAISPQPHCYHRSLISITEIKGEMSPITTLHRNRASGGRCKTLFSLSYTFFHVNNSH
jgi:hypothetical protein